MPTFENEKQELAFYRCLFFELSSSLIQSDVHLIGNLEQYANGNIPHNASPNQIFDVKFDRRVSDYQLDPTIATRVIGCPDRWVRILTLDERLCALEGFLDR